MPDLLIRNVPSRDVELLDQRARRVGLSRSEFLRRQLMREARRVDDAVRVADLAELGRLAADLTDPDVMRDAWS